MDSYPPIPENHPKIKKSENGLNVFSTACWRGYIGTWEITKNRLFLVKIEGIYEIIGNEPIFADWFSGILKNIYFRPFDHSPEEFVFNIEIEKGVVVKTYTL